MICIPQIKALLRDEGNIRVSWQCFQHGRWYEVVLPIPIDCTSILSKDFGSKQITMG